MEETKDNHLPKTLTASLAKVEGAINAQMERLMMGKKMLRVYSFTFQFTISESGKAKFMMTAYGLAGNFSRIAIAIFM